MSLSPDLGPSLEVFKGNNLDFIDKVSFNGVLYRDEVTDAVLKAAAGIDSNEKFSLFSNAVGVDLYGQNIMAPAAECFELALKRQQAEDSHDPSMKTYAGNLVNAITGQIFSLDHTNSKELQIQNIRWFDTKQAILEVATQSLETFNETGALIALGQTYKKIYQLTRDQLLKS